MRKIPIYIILLFSFLFQIQTKANDSIVYKINIKQDIDGTSWLFVKNGLDEAEKMNASCVIFHLNTYGGAVVFADSIRTGILNSSIPTFAFIDNNAASAGALIAIACDKIYMKKGANIGAATVVNQSGEKMPDKYQSYMRATIRATAEAHGKDTVYTKNGMETQWKRNPLIAEAMVDERIIVPGIVDSTQILTFTSEEAVANNYCDGIVDNIDEILTLNNYHNYTLKEYEPSLFDGVKGFLINPVVHGILIMLILGGLYFEMQTPGIGFPLIVSIIAALLYFSPLYIDGVAAYWEIMIFILGIVLLIAEIFLIPGFGIFGILGIIFILGGLVLSLLDNFYFDFSSVPFSEIGMASITVSGGIILTIVLSIYLSSKIGTGNGMFKKVALNAQVGNAEGFVAVETSRIDFVSKKGIAVTDLRPSGKISIDDMRYDAISEDGFIEKESIVIVTRYETGLLYVSKI